MSLAGTGQRRGSIKCGPRRQGAACGLPFKDQFAPPERFHKDPGHGAVGEGRPR